jgi:hypothetical protein
MGTDEIISYGTISTKCYGYASFLALVIWHENRIFLRCIILVLSSVTCLALAYSSTLPHKGHDFRASY